MPTVLGAAFALGRGMVSNSYDESGPYPSISRARLSEDSNR